MRARNENANKCAIDLYTVSVGWKHADCTLTERSELATNTQGFVEGVAYCGRNVSVRLPRRGRAESLHMHTLYSVNSVLVAYGTYVGIRRYFCACINFLDVRNELQRTSAYDNVLWTLARPSPNVLPTCICVWQRMTKSRHMQTYAELNRFMVWRPL